MLCIYQLNDLLLVAVRGALPDPSSEVRVQLVERESAPMGLQLVNANKVNKSSDPMDLVSLAQQVQKVSKYVSNLHNIKNSYIIL